MDSQVKTITEQISEFIGEPIIDEYLSPDRKMFNTGGVECECGEFIYGLVRYSKPERVLETGTHQGIASSYVGLALKANGHGHLETIEYEKLHLEKAKEKWTKLGIQDWITEYLIDSRDFKPSGIYDIVLLDTEPQIRFSEFVKIYPFVKNGGFIIIHDLDALLGRSPTSPWENFEEKFGNRIKDNEIQLIHVYTRRGFTLMQKYSSEMMHFRLRKGEI